MHAVAGGVTGTALASQAMDACRVVNTSRGA
jgi:hypothetical protein